MYDYLNHVSLKRPLRVVVLLDLSDPNKPRYALLFSTDVELDAVVLYHYYKARFQIEFIVPALWLKPPSFRRDRFQRAADLALWYELSRWQPYQI